MAKALVIGTGGYIIVSDNLEEYSEDTWESLKELRQLSLALDVDKKVDIVNPFEDPLRIKGKKIELKISKGPIDLRTNDIIFQGKNESLSVALVKNGNDNRSRAGSR